MTLRWDESLLSAVDEAIAQARSGNPTTMVVEGVAGIGKSALLDLIGERCPDFRQLYAEGVETAAATPFAVLDRLGLDIPGSAVGGLSTSTVAAQQLRTVVDEAAQHGPVCITVDDLHWADHESVDCLIGLIGRAAGDRLLFVVGSRPLDPDQLPTWRRWSSRPGRVRRVTLTGLSAVDAIELVSELRPDIPSALAHSLWEHTDGHPLYLRALVSEFAGADLAAMRILPAPAEFVHTVTARLGRTSTPARLLAQAMVVVGNVWSGLRELAAIAEVTDPAPAVQELVELGLADCRASATDDLLRPAHALVRSAVYQSMPIGLRRELHLRAADVVMGTAAALDHRLAATDQYNDDLAADLEAYASALHEHRSYRLAAHYLSAASAVSADVGQRQRHWLESQFETLLAGDPQSVHAAADDIAQASDVLRRDLVLGALATWERRPLDAIDILARSSGSALSARRNDQGDVDSDSDRHVLYRIESILAWSRLLAGAPEPEILEAIRRANAFGVQDTGVSRLLNITAGQLAGRHVDDPDHLAGLDTLPANPTMAPSDKTELLAWRGAVRSATGRFSLAIADLTELTDRTHGGLHDGAGGAFYAILGRSQWFCGDWALARVNLGLAADFTASYPQPIASALVPLAAISEGDFAQADRQLADARDVIEHTPWLEAVDLLTVTEVIRRHADPGAPALDYEPIRTSLVQLRKRSIRKPNVWLAHAALAALWAGELDDARLCAHDVGQATVGWAAGVSEWLYGLIAEAEGDGRTASARLQNAVSAQFPELPLYRAHALSDHARIALLVGDAGAAASLQAAADSYRALGATTYLNRMTALGEPVESVGAPSRAFGLSDRERDVVALLATGMSYVQIARGLFITRSTVSFHLVNIYAKTNVTSRHELTTLVHENPLAFGLSQPA